jgi:hypothetical protein
MLGRASCGAIGAMVLVALAGCNAIIGNDPPTLRDPDAADKDAAPANRDAALANQDGGASIDARVDAADGD